MADIQAILNDPDFKAASIETRREILSHHDSDFAAASKATQDQILSKGKPSGVLGTIGKGLAFARDVATTGLSDAITGGYSGLPGGYNPPELRTIGDTLAKLIIPQTPAQVGGMAGMIGAGALTGGAAPLLAAGARIAGATLGGATGGGLEAMSEGAPILPGAGQGALEQGGGALLGEAGGALIGKLYRSLPGGKARVNMSDADAIASEIGDLVPALKGAKTPQDLKMMSMSVEPREKMSAAFQNSVNEIDRIIGGRKIVVPSLGAQPVTVEEAVRKISEKGFPGFQGANADPKTTTISGKSLRDLKRQAVEEVTAQLDHYNPTGEASALYEKARKEYAAGLTFLKILRGGGFKGYPDRVDLNVDGVREAFEKQYAKLQGVLAPDELKRVVDVLYRGGPMGGRDKLSALSGGMADASSQLMRSGGGAGTALVAPLRTPLPGLGDQYVGTRLPGNLAPVAQGGLDLLMQQASPDLLKTLQP